MKSLGIPARAYPTIVVAVTFFALLVSAGTRAAPSVMMIPLGMNFGWDRATVSFAAAVGIFLYGLVGPFAAALMLSVGIGRMMIAGLLLMSAATLASLWMRAPWQYVATWGVIAGVGSGAVASVLGAAVVNRWFATRRGLVMGVLSASTATGSLVFLPFMAYLASRGAWQPVALAVSAACIFVVPFVLLFVPEQPGDVGSRHHGEAFDSVPTVMRRAAPGRALTTLGGAAKVPLFWLLFGSFFICGLTTNGLVGTHLIAFCGDHGIGIVREVSGSYNLAFLIAGACAIAAAIAVLGARSATPDDADIAAIPAA